LSSIPVKSLPLLLFPVNYYPIAD